MENISRILIIAPGNFVWKTMNNTSGTHLVNDMTNTIVRKELPSFKTMIYGGLDCEFLNCLYENDAKNAWKTLIWQANSESR